MSTNVENLELSVSIGSASFSASGTTSVVLGLYEDFKNLVQREPAPKHVAKQQKSENGNEESSGSVKLPTELPLKPYVSRLTLRGNKEKATAIVAWAAESGEKPALTVQEIEQYWKKLPFKAPANLTRDVRKAESEGWLDSDGKAGSAETTYQINGYGEGIVAGWVAGEE